MLQNNVWDKMFVKNTAKYPSENLVIFIARNFPEIIDREHIKILEIGSGGGANLFFLAKEGFDVYGVDGSEVAINKSRELFLDEKCSVSLCLGDILSLNYEDNFFDLVIDSECLYSNDTESSIKIIGEIKRVLKVNGLFYSRTFSLDTFKGSPKRINKYEFRDSVDGPFANTGFFRLSDKLSVSEMYGVQLNILLIDKLVHTRNNGKMKISELVIVSKK
tara:strand:- start:446 stop:1102 length:657 start_codon:yes stop_codon:yes gene_type:complete